MWVSDSESAVWSVNKGRCDEEMALPYLSNMLQLCDDRSIQLLALWVPREENQLADYLSHYAFLSDRDVVSGWVSELASAPDAFGEDSC